MSDERQRILIVYGDMRPLAEEVRSADLVIKVPTNHTPQVLKWDGPAKMRPIVARSHYKKPRAWDD